MTLVKTNYRPVQKNFSSLFDELFNELPNFWGNLPQAGNSVPPVNISETAEAYHLDLIAPGRNKEDFKVNVENGLLTISYEKKEETKSEEPKTVRREFSFQSFKRSFSLDDRLDTGKIQARYENGVLKLVLPKKTELKEAATTVTIQ